MLEMLKTAMLGIYIAFIQAINCYLQIEVFDPDTRNGRTRSTLNKDAALVR